MDESQILNLVEDLAEVIEDGKPPLGQRDKKIIDANAALDIIDEIKDVFPGEFSEARRIARDRTSILENAEADANRIIEDARNQAIMIGSEQEIVRIAKQTAENVLSEAHEQERKIKSGADDYADQVFSSIETTIDGINDHVRRCRERLNNRG